MTAGYRNAAELQTDAPPLRISRTVSGLILSTGIPKIARAHDPESST